MIERKQLSSKFELPLYHQENKDAIQSCTIVSTSAGSTIPARLVPSMTPFRTRKKFMANNAHEMPSTPASRKQYLIYLYIYIHNIYIMSSFEPHFLHSVNNISTYKQKNIYICGHNNICKFN